MPGSISLLLIISQGTEVTHDVSANSIIPGYS